ncbi:MAG: symmetrical bis(5'-nucleosyl)-tetraphosphatase [Gammaproteobacteria bacterium]|jgi:bis(5'-nucleosyl)-tetraphosphatase (symmetrical)|nr:symmetrical bis(5'-nucleosyl)-tetraphosphatase [Gammaproteobacteria bacterium]MBT6041970.1 symmetrical bis(5'-nucleosyl)-tetraphosphatase [Gammaproteobacteria bacterium]
MATYAVGDIQGCYDQLMRILEKVKFDPASDRLWGVGDLINRGSKSLETLRFLKSLGDSFTTVLGNHDLHFVAMATGAQSHGKKDTLQALLDDPECLNYCDWLRHQPMIHNESINTESGQQSFLVVHAGIAPGWTFKKARKYAAEVEAVLQSDKYKKFLTMMYGDEPDIWHDGLDGMERLRVITNYLTRVRFCNEETQLNLAIKSGPKTAPEGFKPWYEYQQLKEDKVILFGHWATLEGVTNWPNIYALDTGCVWGRDLTVLRLEDKRRYSVPFSNSK